MRSRDCSSSSSPISSGRLPASLLCSRLISVTRPDAQVTPCQPHTLLSEPQWVFFTQPSEFSDFANACSAVQSSALSAGSHTDEPEARPAKRKSDAVLRILSTIRLSLAKIDTMTR